MRRARQKLTPVATSRAAAWPKQDVCAEMEHQEKQDVIHRGRQQRGHREPRQHEVDFQRVEDRVEMGRPIAFEVDCLDRARHDRHSSVLALNEHVELELVAGGSQAEQTPGQHSRYSAQAALRVAEPDSHGGPKNMTGQPVTQQAPPGNAAGELTRSEDQRVGRGFQGVGHANHVARPGVGRRRPR